MLDNAPPRVIALFDAFSIIQLLSEPEGLKQLKVELKPLIDAALTAYKQLGKRQREISDAEAKLKAAQDQHRATAAGVEQDRQAVDATIAAMAGAQSEHQAQMRVGHQKLDAREAKLKEDQQQHRQDKQDLAKAQADLAAGTSELATLKGQVEKRETAAQQLMAKAEALRADYETRLKGLKAHLQQAQA